MNRDELLAIRLDLLKRNFPEGSHPTIVGVTKKRPIEDIIYSYKAGLRDFGENRVDELLEKSKAILNQGIKDINWHFIGPLQSNKVKMLLSVPGLRAIHSIDRYKVLQSLKENYETFLGEKCNLFLQVNTSDEKEKGGFKDWDELAPCINFFENNNHLPFKLHGLMTMSKIRTNNFKDDALKCFKQLVKIKRSLEKDFFIEKLMLSMGMSNDYEIALSVGTDYLRIGSFLYGPDIRDQM